MDEQLIRKIAKEEAEKALSFGQKKIGDTPTDDLQLANKKYVDDNAANSGVYTPTLTNMTNVDSSTAYPTQYLQAGDSVIVFGKVDIDATSTSPTELGVSLPIPSNFASADDCSGTFNILSSSAQGQVIGDATNNRATISYIAQSTGNVQGNFAFMYQII